jgi:DNA/RNA-binding domain of Phe-tRNA-synthetase-like protein
MILISSSGAWRKTFPGAVIGLLELSQVDNKQGSTQLEKRKRHLEAHLRTAYRGFDRNDFLAIPILAAYKDYYRGFKKTYHVQLQIESIVLHGKGLPKVSPLVDANFVAEMETFVLTAGHDAARLKPPVLIDVSRTGESMTQMGGESKALRADDMVMRDADAICCSIIYGQDDRSPISTATRHVLYVCYAPPGVTPEAVSNQLQSVEENVRLFSPSAIVEQRQLISAD